MSNSNRYTKNATSLRATLNGQRTKVTNAMSKNNAMSNNELNNLKKNVDKLRSNVTNVDARFRKEYRNIAKESVLNLSANEINKQTMNVPITGMNKALANLRARINKKEENNAAAAAAKKREENAAKIAKQKANLNRLSKELNVIKRKVNGNK